VNGKSLSAISFQLRKIMNEMIQEFKLRMPNEGYPITDS
jgi:hypothetical protein